MDSLVSNPEPVGAAPSRTDPAMSAPATVPGSGAGSASGDPPAPAPVLADATPNVEGEASAALTVDQVRMVLRRVKDPDLNLNIVDLGLVYDVRVDGAVVTVDMSLTSPGCPSGPEIMGEAERQIRDMPGVTDVAINLVWTPFWSPDRIEPRVRAYLGM
jgi:metal-sulfur cluster biosynthetic enzyme